MTTPTTPNSPTPAPGQSRDTPTILYLAADLIWATRIKGTAEALGLPARPVRNVEMLRARLADTAVAAVVLDLDVPEMAMAMLDELRGEQAPAAHRAVRTLAWGPHAAKDLLQRARDAGADDVLTRGTFDHALPDILTRLALGAR